MRTKPLIVIVAFLILTALAVAFMLNRSPEQIPNDQDIPAPVQPAEHAMIRVESPKPNEIIKSPLTIKGEARGNWYFEASFPIRLLDADGKEIPLDPSYVMTSENWMTTEFVPFETTHIFAAPATATGTLVIMKDNPSGLPQYDDQITIPVRFSQEVSAKGCMKTGCSGQICSDEAQITTCEYRPEYACYQSAKCERQSDGKCGWTETQELMACLSSN